MFRVTHVADTNLSILTPINVDKRWFPQARLYRQLKPISVPGGGNLLVEEWSRVETPQDITSSMRADEGPASAKESKTKCENDSAEEAPPENQSIESDEKSTENSNSENPEKSDTKSPESSTKPSKDPTESGIMGGALLGFGGLGAPGMSMGVSNKFLSPTQIEQHVGPSLVFVRTAIPYAVDGYHCPNGFIGTGLVVDAEQGLIVVDRNTVPASLVDVTLSFTHHQVSLRVGLGRRRYRCD